MEKKTEEKTKNPAGAPLSIKEPQTLAEIKESISGSKEYKSLFGLIKESREIFGEENVIGPDDLEKYFGLFVAPEDIDAFEMPLSLEELRQAKERDEILIARIPLIELHNGFVASTIRNLIIKFPSLFYDSNKYLELYGEYYFFSKEITALGWSLVKKNILEESLSLNFNDQENLLNAYIEKNKLPRWRIRRRKPVEIVYDAILYYLKNQKRLLASNFEWSFSSDPYGKDASLIQIGKFDQKGIKINKFQNESNLSDKSAGLVPQSVLYIGYI